MFGRERPHAGVIINPSEDVRDVELFRDAIWYYVMNLLLNSGADDEY